MNRTGGVVLLLAFIILIFASFFLRMRDESKALTRDIALVKLDFESCRRSEAQERERGNAFKDMAERTEYILWEVHALPGAWPSTNQQIEDLCSSLGDHSVLGLGAELHGYSVWSDPEGKPRLGCRYVKERDHGRLGPPP